MTAMILGRIRNLRNRINAEGIGFNDGDYYLDYIPTPEVAITLTSNPKPSVKQSRKPAGTEPIVLSLLLLDRFFAEGGKDASSLITLYLFYYQQARKQKTNQPWATNRFVAKNTHIGISKVKKLKQKLITMELIQNIPKPGKDGKIQHWYIRVNYLWNTATSMNFIPVVTDTTSMKSPPVVKSSDNALSENKINSSSEEKIKIKKGDFLSVKDLQREETKEKREDKERTPPQNPISFNPLNKDSVVNSLTPLDSLNNNCVENSETPEQRKQRLFVEHIKKAVPLMFGSCKFSKEECWALFATEQKYYESKGYPNPDWDGQLEFWRKRLIDASGKVNAEYRDLLKVWANYCIVYEKLFREYPEKTQFQGITQQQAKELMNRIEQDKMDFAMLDKWRILPIFIKEFLEANGSTPFCTFSGLFKKKAWQTFNYRQEEVVVL